MRIMRCRGSSHADEKYHKTLDTLWIFLFLNGAIWVMIPSILWVRKDLKEPLPKKIFQFVRKKPV